MSVGSHTLIEQVWEAGARTKRIVARLHKPVPAPPLGACAPTDNEGVRRWWDHQLRFEASQRERGRLNSEIYPRILAKVRARNKRTN